MIYTRQLLKNSGTRAVTSEGITIGVNNSNFFLFGIGIIKSSEFLAFHFGELGECESDVFRILELFCLSLEDRSFLQNLLTSRQVSSSYQTHAFSFHCLQAIRAGPRPKCEKFGTLCCFTLSPGIRHQHYLIP